MQNESHKIQEILGSDTASAYLSGDHSSDIVAKLIKDLKAAGVDVNIHNLETKMLKFAENFLEKT